MSNQTDYTPDEWKTISAAPIMAGLLVTVSDLSGPIGTAKEAYAVVKGVTDAAARSNNDLIKAIAEGINKQGGKPELPQTPRDQAGARAALIEGCRQAVAIVAQRSPAEVDEFKEWLSSLAQKTAEASKEGGFLGFGGTPVSDAENSALKELAAALGKSAKA